jgi:polygalacturonase
VTISNVTGTASPKAMNYYVLCGSDSCSNFSLNDVSISGGAKGDYCNQKWSGNFQCPTVKPTNLIKG